MSVQPNFQNLFGTLMNNRDLLVHSRENSSSKRDASFVSMQCKEPHYFSNVRPSQSKKGTDEQMSAQKQIYVV